jgi:nucleoside 2-deoxyribosyltransferase
MNIFLSVAYSSQVDDTGRILPAYQRQLQAIINLFEADRHQVFCAPREDNWTLPHTTPAAALELDTHHLDACDLIIAFLSRHISAGIQLELGYALAKNKRLILAAKTHEPLSFVNRGLIDSGAATLLTYDNDETDLLAKLAAVQTRPIKL